jgi:hypothetical protein
MRMPYRLGPLALTTTYTTNICNPGTTTGGVNSTGAPYDKLKIVLRKIRIINKTGSAATFRLFIGATGANAAGTEFMGYDQSVAANSFFEWVGFLSLAQADFLVGGSNTATALTIEGEGEIFVGA